MAISWTNEDAESGVVSTLPAGNPPGYDTNTGQFEIAGLHLSGEYTLTIKGSNQHPLVAAPRSVCVEYVNSGLTIVAPPNAPELDVQHVSTGVGTTTVKFALTVNTETVLVKVRYP